VLLLEAGTNFSPDAYPKVLKNPAIVGTSEFDWQYHTDDATKLGHDIPVPRSRVVGGSSAVNGSVAMRARPTDFLRWARRGIHGWSWDEVLAVYKFMENTHTGDDAWHGRGGPFPIRQRNAAENTLSMRAFVKASQKLGLPLVDDFNAANQFGVGPIRSMSSMTCASTRVWAISRLPCVPGQTLRSAPTLRWTKSWCRTDAL